MTSGFIVDGNLTLINALHTNIRHIKNHISKIQLSFFTCTNIVFISGSYLSTIKIWNQCYEPVSFGHVRSEFFNLLYYAHIK